MDWIQLSISTTTEGVEPVCAVLMEAGVIGMEIDDALDFHNFLENNHDKWDYVDDDLMAAHESGTFVRFYVTDNACGADMRAQVLEGLAALSAQDEENEYGTLEVTANGMKEEDCETFAGIVEQKQVRLTKNNYVKLTRDDYAAIYRGLY